jgi:thioester reductase-like protein/aryl carrier-like protein
MEEVGEDQYEMVLYRDMSLKRFRQLCHTSPDHQIWTTKDVFKLHPTEPNLWQFQGRIDDIMVLTNGEKFNPVPTEKRVEGHPLVYGALMVGQGKEQPAAMAAQDLIDAIWPLVQEANSRAPAYGRVSRSMILVSDAGKPFARAGKGTIVRKLSVAVFSKEIENLYSNKEYAVNDVPLLDPPYDQPAIQSFVKTAFKTYLPEAKLEDESDFFVLGLDSLQTLECVSRLKAGLRAHPHGGKSSWLSAKTIYANPTIKALSQEFDDRLNLEDGISNGVREHDAERSSRMSAIVDKHTRATSNMKSVPKAPSRDSGLTVVLTRSIGALGTHLLEALLNDHKVSRIYCMNRSADARDRHEKNFRDKGLGCAYDLGDSPVYFDASGILSCKKTNKSVHFLKVDFGASEFGLERSLFDELKANVDIIIHNAWKVDFLHNLESFEPVHIRGVRNFIEWSMQSERKPHIAFVSLISSVGNWAVEYPGRRPVPETPHENYKVASQLGYGESEHVSERILSFATKRCRVPTSILRVGHIAGPLKENGGAWHETEWFPTLVKTSKNLGLIPDIIPDINWIPVDTLAIIMLELVHHATKNSISQVYNIVNPRFATWADLVPSIQKHYEPVLKVVIFQEWLETLKILDINNPEEISGKPALKILDFYEVLALGDATDQLTYDTRPGQEGSYTMAKLSAVRPSWVRTWLKQWDF